MCNAPRKKFVNLDAPPDPALTKRVYDSCIKSDHPNVHICKKIPKSKDARKSHRRVKRLLYFIKKKGAFRSKIPEIFRSWKTKMRKKTKRKKKGKKGMKRNKKKMPKSKKMKKSLHSFFHFDYAMV